MKKFLISSLVIVGIALPAIAAPLNFKAVPKWSKPANGDESIGNQHGDVAVASNGEVYVSVTGGAKQGLQVFGADGNYLRNVPDAPNDFHGFVIHKNKEGEFIYGSRSGGQTILKMTLAGKVVMTIPGSAIPDKYKRKGRGKNAKPALRLTAVDVAPNGDIFTADGYAGGYVHHFDRKGKYLNSFGGRGRAPYNFSTLHKIAVDTRFDPPRIIGADRENLRVVHMSYEGEFIGVVANDLLFPAAVVIQGDLAIVGEIGGGVTLLDKNGNVVKKLGHNDRPKEVKNNKTPPNVWRPGMVTAPHGVAFNKAGDIFVAEYSIYGRVHRFNRMK
jgi:hypothetical protein